MSKKEVIKFDPAIPAQFSKWFGAPPGFTNDDLQIHGEIVCALVHEVHPQDSFERMFIGDLAYLLCERLAWRRCRANRIRQAHHEKFERLEREVLLDAERRKEEVRKGPPPDPLAESLARWSAKSQTELAAERELREIETNKRLAAIDADTGKKLAELQKAKDGPIDEAACFDQWIDDVERIEKLSTEVDRKIINTLKNLDQHRTGLGQRLRQAIDEVIDVEFAEEPGPAREEAVPRAESAFNAEVSKGSTQPTTRSNVAALPAPVSSQTDADTSARSQVLAEPAP
jgi:hypothetical protein